MPHYMDYFPSKFASARDMAAGDRRVVIAGLGTDELRGQDGTKQTKLIVRFTDAALKPLVLNKTNARVISGMFGDETEAWIGQTIILYQAEVEAFGKMVYAVRVRMQVAPPPPGPAEPKGKPKGRK